MPAAAPLERRLVDLIRAEGPISVARYMELALSDPEHGYYRRHDPLGTGGDFITAPEISQLFGELVGLWAAVVWQLMGRPRSANLVELGPGRGTLMSDALRTAGRTMPEFTTALDLHLVETSEALRAKQRAALAGHDVRWHNAVDDLPGGPTIVLANEFFDALPVRQFELTDAGWRERLVAVDAAGGGLCFTTAALAASSDRLAWLERVAPAGGIVELRPAADAIVAALAARLARHGGAALIVDYGHGESAAGDTLQAVRKHRYVDPLTEPGSADLTAHVDFAALAAGARVHGLRVHGPTTQRAFLRALGIEARAAQLMAATSGDRRAAVERGCLRLIGADQMGTLFKVVALSHPALDQLPGFEPRP